MKPIEVEKRANIGITLDDLFTIVYKCIKRDIPKNTPVMISQNKDKMVSKSIQIIADENSIIIYDWI